MHRSVRLPRSNRPSFAPNSFDLRHDVLEQQFDAALAVDGADGAIIGPDAMMPGRVFSTMYFSFSITCFGVPATIMVLLIWSSNVGEPRGFLARPVANSTNHDGRKARNSPTD